MGCLAVVVYRRYFCGGEKFDRYLLPAIPALTLLAAVVWNQVRLPRGNRWLLPVLVGAQMAYLLTAVPYPLAAYNPLLGGPPAAAQLMTVGWGEAIGTAGSWLTENREGEGATAVASIAPSLAPFFAGTTLLQSDETLARADYVVVTAADRQADGEQVAALTQDMTLLHTIHYAGLDQAWIYQQVRPATPVNHGAVGCGAFWCAGAGVGCGGGGKCEAGGCVDSLGIEGADKRPFHGQTTAA
ncbi:MAG: hypothetical protein R3E31_14540 [Chloroflexota bacterium]